MVGLMRPGAFGHGLDSEAPAVDAPSAGACARRGRAIIVGALLSMLVWAGLIYLLVWVI